MPANIQLSLGKVRLNTSQQLFDLQQFVFIVLKYLHSTLSCTAVLTILDYPKKCFKSYLEQCFKPPFKTHKKRNPFWYVYDKKIFVAVLFALLCLCT